MRYYHKTSFEPSNWYRWFLVLNLFLWFFLLTKSAVSFCTLGDISSAFDLWFGNSLYHLKGLSKLFPMMLVIFSYSFMDILFSLLNYYILLYILVTWGSRIDFISLYDSSWILLSFISALCLFWSLSTSFCSIIANVLR